jgi:alpha-tubulin suppressor-like RCC1 family protein
VAVVSVIVLVVRSAYCDGVYGWGANSHGELGDGTTTNRLSPVPISSLASGVTAIAIGSGQFHSLAIQNGMAYGWGYNGDGEVGDNSTTDRTSPVPLSSMPSGVTVVAAGYYHSMAVMNGAAYAWGNNAFGQVGDGTFVQRNTPVAISSLASGVTAMAGGHFFSVAVQNGAVYGWGDNLHGELGNGSMTTDQPINPPLSQSAPSPLV